MTTLNEQELEQELQARGLNATRLTPEMIDATIQREDYWRVPNTVCVVCALTLRNGFVVVGEAAPVSPENFDEGVGRNMARDNAREQIWKLEGYLLRQWIFNTIEQKAE